MRTWQPIDAARTPEGTELTLHQSGRAFLIRANGRGLMGSDQHGSEEALASLGCAHARTVRAPTVLVGGLGMGFTLRAALDDLPADAEVVVAELLEAVVAWNRGPLGALAGHPLADSRVRVEAGDVAVCLRSNPGRFDTILLDVDNGPVAMVEAANAGLYQDEGLATARAALREGGVLALWSAWEDKKFEHRLRHAGFVVETLHVRARLTAGGPNHTLFLGRVGHPPLNPRERALVRSEGRGRRRPS